MRDDYGLGEASATERPALSMPCRTGGSQSRCGRITAAIAGALIGVVAAGVLYALVCAYLHWVGLALAGDAARRLRVKRQHVPPAVRVSAAGILEAASTPGVCGLLVDHGLCD